MQHCGGQLQRSRQTDTKYHLFVDAVGLPLAAIASATNVNDTRLLRHLLNRALLVSANVGRLIADAGYDSQDNSAYCSMFDVLPLIRVRGDKHGSNLGTIRHIVENTISWLLMNKRLVRPHDPSTLLLQALLTAACTFIAAKRALEF